MKCTQVITLTGYTVKYVDLREPKPRTPQEVIFVVDKELLDALAVMGENTADYITARYERAGFHVLSVERISGRRTLPVDLRQLWETAKPLPTGAEESAV